MKKIIALMTALLMLFAFAGCGAENTSSGASDKTDSEYVKEKGKLVIGITEYAPMDYKEEGSDEWIGFDADLAKAFAESLGVEAEFVVLADWGGKIMELDSKSIDVVWNGMTLTDEVKNGMEVSNPYCTNTQVVVVPKDQAEQYSTVESVKDLSFAAESGSAGEDALQELGYSYTAVKAQSDALMEVKAGTSQAAVIDRIMAGSMIGEGTNYSDLAYTATLGGEENYVVGFRKGSDLAGQLNQFFKDSYADGSMMQIAEKYGIQDSIIEQK